MQAGALPTELQPRQNSCSDRLSSTHRLEAQCSHTADDVLPRTGGPRSSWATTVHNLSQRKFAMRVRVRSEAPCHSSSTPYRYDEEARRRRLRCRRSAEALLGAADAQGQDEVTGVNQWAVFPNRPQIAHFTSTILRYSLASHIPGWFGRFTNHGLWSGQTKG